MGKYESTLKRYYSKSVLLKKRGLLEVVKKGSKRFSQFPLVAKIRLNAFDSVQMTTMHFAKLCHYKRLILQISRRL